MQATKMKSLLLARTDGSSRSLLKHGGAGADEPRIRQSSLRDLFASKIILSIHHHHHNNNKPPSPPQPQTKSTITPGIPQDITVTKSADVSAVTTAPLIHNNDATEVTCGLTEESTSAIFGDDDQDDGLVLLMEVPPAPASVEKPQKKKNKKKSKQSKKKSLSSSDKKGRKSSSPRRYRYRHYGNDQQDNNNNNNDSTRKSSVRSTRSTETSTSTATGPSECSSSSYTETAAEIIACLKQERRNSMNKKAALRHNTVGRPNNSTSTSTATTNNSTISTTTKTSSSSASSKRAQLALQRSQQETRIRSMLLMQSSRQTQSDRQVIGQPRSKSAVPPPTRQTQSENVNHHAHMQDATTITTTTTTTAQIRPSLWHPSKAWSDRDMIEATFANPKKTMTNRTSSSPLKERFDQEEQRRHSAGKKLMGTKKVPASDAGVAPATTKIKANSVRSATATANTSPSRRRRPTQGQQVAMRPVSPGQRRTQNNVSPLRTRRGKTMAAEAELMRFIEGTHHLLMGTTPDGSPTRLDTTIKSTLDDVTSVHTMQTTQSTTATMRRRVASRHPQCHANRVLDKVKAINAKGPQAAMCDVTRLALESAHAPKRRATPANSRPFLAPQRSRSLTDMRDMLRPKSDPRHKPRRRRSVEHASSPSSLPSSNKIEAENTQASSVLLKNPLELVRNPILPLVAPTADSAPAQTPSLHGKRPLSRRLERHQRAASNRALDDAVSEEQQAAMTTPTNTAPRVSAIVPEPPVHVEEKAQLYQRRKETGFKDLGLLHHMEQCQQTRAALRTIGDPEVLRKQKLAEYLERAKVEKPRGKNTHGLSVLEVQSQLSSLRSVVTQQKYGKNLQEEWKSNSNYVVNSRRVVA